MRKYLFLIKMQFGRIATYRFEFWWHWIMSIAHFGVYASLWLLTANGNETETHRIILYFALFFGILDRLQSGKVADNMGRAINFSDIDQWLLKPIYYPAVEVCDSIGRLIARIIFPIIIFISLSFIRPEIFAPAGATNLLLFILFSFLGFILWNLLIITLGSLAFWFLEIDNLMTVFDLILHFLKGRFIPAFLFPIWLTGILKYTFVPYLISLPISTYMGESDSPAILTALQVSFLWILILAALAGFTYKSGLKRYESHSA